MFIHPLLAWGTLLGSVPIIIHLLNKRRFRPVTWAAMEFLMKAIQQNARRLQLRDIILMLIRTAAIVLLALAIARPAINARGVFGLGMKTGAVILIDNSMSMGYNNGNETRFDVGKRLAKLVLSQLEQGSTCAIYTFNDEVRAPLGDPSQNLAYIEQEMDRSVLLSDGGTNVEKALAKTQKLFQSHPDYKVANREIYIITDMQSSAWNNRNATNKFPVLLKELTEAASIYLVNAGDPGVENLGIVDLSPSDTLATVDMPVTFVGKVKNFGQVDANGVRVDFYVDPKGGDAKPQERTTVSVAHGEVATVSFETHFTGGGDHKVEMRLADDKLMGDNRRFCTLEVIEETHVLLVDGRDQRSDDPLSNETGYLRFALSPRDPENPDKQSVVVTESVPHYRLGDKNLMNYQAVVLADVGKLSQANIAALDRQVRAGMGLMIFLGEQADAALYNSMLGENGAKILPAKIGVPWGEAVTIDTKGSPVAVSFATDKVSHPIMSDFGNPDFGAQLLSDVQTYRSFELEPAVTDSVRVVAYFANGKPAIVERRVGSGYVLLFAFPATTSWSNFPTQPAFTIIMLRAANMLTLGNRPPKNLAVNQSIHALFPLSDQSTSVKITPPLPAPRKETRPEPTGDGKTVLDFNETERSGFYDVVLDRVPKVSMTYAFNPNAEVESKLDTVAPEQLKRDFPGFDFNYVAKSDDFTGKLTGQRHGTELYLFLMIMVFLLLATESFLTHRWAPKD